MLKAVVLVCAVVTTAQVAVAKIDDRFFSPYVDATAYPITLLDKIFGETGVKFFSLGFIVSGRNDPCEPSWGGYYDIQNGPSSWSEGHEDFLYDHIRLLREMGGDVIISLGGEAGDPLYGCTDNQKLYDALVRTQNVLNASYFDFDIEGSALADRTNANRLAKAVKQLQSTQPGLRVSLTLPVLPSGLTTDGVNVVNIFKNDNGVTLDAVNIMAMNFGNSVAPPGSPMSQYITESMMNTANQVGGPSIVGVTPMIGKNHIITEFTTLADAALVTNYAREGNYKSVSMWSINRDHSCNKTYVSIICSSRCRGNGPCQNADYQYAETFNQFVDARFSSSGSGEITSHQ